MLNKGSILVMAVLIALLVLTSWYVATLTRITPFSGGASFNMGALTNAHVIQTTDAGAVQYQGTMQSASQFNNGDINFMGLNVILYGAAGNTPWTLAADSGEVLDQSTQVNLNGNVTLSQPGTAKNPPILIQTQSATLFPKRNQVTGNDLITFTQPGTINRVSGVGFIADMQAKWIKLLSQVKSVYEAK